MKPITSLSIEDARAAQVFRALGNPARILILQELARRKTCVHGDLADVLPLAASTVSEHLAVLKDAGLIRGPIDGDPCYCIEPAALQWLETFVQSVRVAAEGCDMSDPNCC